MGNQRRGSGSRIKREARELYYLPAPEDSERRRQPWTAEEDAMVAAGGMGLRALAALVGRSMKAVETRRTILRKRANQQGG